MTNLNDLFESKFLIDGTRMPNGNYSSWTDQIKFDAFQESWSISQAEIEALKKEHAELQKEHAELLTFNEKLDRDRNKYRADAQKFAKKIGMISGLFVVPSDDYKLTINAIKTIVEMVGEHS